MNTSRNSMRQIKYLSSAIPKHPPGMTPINVPDNESKSPSPWLKTFCSPHLPVNSLNLETEKKNPGSLIFRGFLVGHPGLEPGTPWLRVRCSTSWANGPCNQDFTIFRVWKQVLLRNLWVGRQGRTFLSHVGHQGRTLLSHNAASFLPAGFAALQFIVVKLIHDGGIGLEELVEKLDFVKGI